ncbi:MAG: hypothetical protein HOP17_04510 [Acidobacteria bacterium]|nr:hypothetical protein [Acidobacteriota bacterium]
MFRKFFVLVSAALVLAFVAVDNASAQGAGVRGEVKIKKADGTLVPAPDVLVEVFRTDTTKGTLPSATTNKKGQFTFVQFPYAQTFALAVSGAGINPMIEPGVKAGRENIVITVSEGDGHKLTEAEVRQTLASAVNVQSGELTAAQKKEQEEFEKKNAEITAKNKKIQEGDAVAGKANVDGVAALKAKDYATAIAKFGEGVAAVPDFVGSTPVMLNGKMVAHRARGYEFYREGVTNSDFAVRKAKYDEANKDYDEGLAAFAQAMAVIKGAPAATDPNDQKQRAGITLELLTNAVEVHRLKAIGGVDFSKTADAATVIDEYIAAEPDPAKKTSAKVTLGDIMRVSGEFEKAIAAYKSVLEVAPDNNEVMASLGLSLVALGTSVEPANKEQLQEGLNYMQKYADTVSILPTDPKHVQEFKQSVKDTVEYLKTEQKLKPQATPKATGGKRKT